VELAVVTDADERERSVGAFGCEAEHALVERDARREIVDLDDQMVDAGHGRVGPGPDIAARRRGSSPQARMIGAAS
jgi:hypothetical protein